MLLTRTDSPGINLISSSSNGNSAAFSGYLFHGFRLLFFNQKNKIKE